MAYGDNCKFEDLVGQTLTAVHRLEYGKKDGDELHFVTDDGTTYRMYHSQDCCESVNIDDICGDLDDLIGSPILLAEEVSSDENPPGVEVHEYQDSFTWTFYKLATIKGSVTIRWYGSSNGYYSEEVSLLRYAPSEEI